MSDPQATAAADAKRRVRAATVRHVLRDSGYALMGHAIGLLETQQLSDQQREELERIVSEATTLLADLTKPFAAEVERYTQDIDGEVTIADNVRGRLRGRMIQIARRAMTIKESVRPELDGAVEALMEAADQFAGLLEPSTWAPGAERPQTVNALAPVVEAVLREPEESTTPPHAGATERTILVVDDDSSHRGLLSRYLKREGYRVVQADNGATAMSALGGLAFDLVLLDIIMPAMDGYETLRAIKKNPSLQEIPVIMVSSFEHSGNVAFCIELGAEDYLTKPVNPPLLLARVASSIEKKRLRDRERGALEQLKREQERSDELLLNILPAPVARRLHLGQTMVAQHFEAVTVMFADLVNFTAYSATVSPSDLVHELNIVFKTLDTLVDEHRVEKIKTIGDAYLAVGGLPEPCTDHAERIARLALGSMAAVHELNEKGVFPLPIRIGLHSGPVTAGVIGRLKFAYDIWGDTVNVASRMEASSAANQIHVSASTRALLGAAFDLEERSPIDLKGVGTVTTWLLKGER